MGPIRQRRLSNPFNVASTARAAAGIFRMLRRSRGATRTTTRKRTTIAPGPITSQYDVRTVYRKKRMPRRRRRRYVRFVRKVQHVAMKATALQTQLIRENKILGQPANLTSYCAQLMYTGAGAGGLQGTTTGTVGPKGKTDDLVDMTTDGTLTNNPTALIHYQSCTMDCTIRNFSPGPVVVEVYHIVARTDVQDNATYHYAENIYELGFAQPTPVNEGTSGTNRTRISATDIGTTPFNNSLFSRYFMVKKKTKIELGTGELSQIQLRDPRNHRMNTNKIRNQVYIPGVTQGYLFQVMGSPNGLNDPSQFTEAHVVGITTTRIYNYHIINSNFSRNAISE
nr:Cap [Trichosanthes kirilowii geminiviridae]